MVSGPLDDARRALYDRQSELVPVGKRAADVTIEEQSKQGLRPRPRRHRVAAPTRTAG